MRAKFGRDPMAGSKKVTFKFIILEMHPLAAASRSRLTVRNVLLYMRSHGSALNLSLRQT